MMEKITLIIVLLLAVFLSGCGSKSSDEMMLTEEFESALKTAIVETNAASLTQMEGSAEPSSPTLEIPNPEIQPALSPTAVFISQPTPTITQIIPTATSLPTPCYRAELIEETIPDGTKFPPGKWFGKTWVVRNTGVCEWTKDFHWVLIEGEDFSGVTDVKLNQSVQPGEDIRILLELKAPLVPGAYKGTYQIITEDGASVTPLGFWVTIVVE